MYREAPQEVRSLHERVGKLEAEIEQAMARWEELEARNG
ncbi:MAG: hypothetical protein ACOZCP_09295 [Pseudomonadota bacterium]